MSEVRYHRVSPKFWSDPTVIGWNDDTRLLALYILTCEHRTTEGLFRLPKQYIQADLEWSAQRLTEPFARLVHDGFIDYDETARVMLIVKALQYQSPSNPNGVKAALKALSTLPPNRLYKRFYGLAEQYCERLHEALPEPLHQLLTDPQALAPSPAPKPMSEGREEGGEKEFASDKPTRPVKNLRHQPLFDALVDACGLSGSKLTRNEGGRVGKAAKQLAEIDATPDDVKAKAAAYRKKWPEVDLTPTGLVSNWSQIQAKPAGDPAVARGPDVGDPTWEEQQRERQRELERQLLGDTA